MSLVKTYYLNCEDNGEVATEQNDTIRFDVYTLWPHCTFMSAMCYSFWKAQLMQQEGLNEPRKICILVDKKIINEKAKKENKSTGIDMLDWFINNIQPTINGLIISIYSHKITVPYVEDRWSASTIWPLKKEWQWKGGGGYFTIQDTEGNVSLNKQLNKDFHRTTKIIKNIDEYAVLPVKRINYTMSEEEIFTLLKYSNLHFSYSGGTYYTAGMISCPTVGLYNEYMPKVPTSYYDQYDDSKYKTETIEWGWWNLGVCNDVGRLCQYDGTSVIQHPQKYLKHVSMESELLSYLKCQSDFVVNGKRYEIS